jgi:hypothetical protein
MPVYKRCKVCDSEFAVTPSLAEKRDYCSLECRGASQQKLIEKECSVCGKLFKIKAYRKETATCSKECGYVAKKVKKNCVICGNDFLVPKCRSETAKTCSNECAKKARPITNNRKIELVCECCGKAFYEAKSHVERRRFCSIKCRDNSLIAKDEMSKRVSGNLNPMWKGGIVKQSEGYVYKHIVNHPFVGSNNYILEHRLVMEEWLRDNKPEHDFMITVYGVSYLRPEIQVHHIDENKANNKQGNLLAVTISAHRAIHNGNKPSPGTYWPDDVTNFII